MIEKLKYYISNSLNPYKNLAVEKYLLDNIEDDCITLYLWQNDNTVVIGRNQNPWAECNCSLLEKEGGHLARRLSGGGGVFHDTGNLNFTFLCSTGNYDLTKHMQVIKNACAISGIEVEISGRNDILAEGRKFSGNAFYSSKGKSYHHGTILISADMEKMSRYLTPPEAKLISKGVKSVKSRTINLSEINSEITCGKMKENMLTAFSKTYGLTPELYKIKNTDEISILEKNYQSWEYLYGSTFPFSASLKEHFSWGHIEILLQVEKGVIKDLKVYSDSMDWELPDKIISALQNCRFEGNDLKISLSKTIQEPVADDILKLITQLNID